MGGNNTECLAELDDYLHQEYLAKKGANSLFSIFGQKIDVQFCKYIQARVWMRRCLIEIWWEIFFISQTCFPNQYCSIIFRKISPWFFPFVKKSFKRKSRWSVPWRWKASPASWTGLTVASSLASMPSSSPGDNKTIFVFVHFVFVFASLFASMQSSFPGDNKTILVFVHFVFVFVHFVMIKREVRVARRSPGSFDAAAP